ncbi:MAG: RES family NAD+ phosphorylase [Burkholderiaceae bacterium]|nr:RES family NAD+ phosphorylase [Burkholderiaceae bacterium]MDZ4145082.1 RES family NAD+ phosphorylase [Burkholderiales bacterium]
MKLWRIAAETRRYAATDLSGRGASISPGRWNHESEAVVYCAPTIAIAVLETAAHIDDAGLPLDRYLVEIDVPTAVWKARITMAVATLPPQWDAIPAGMASTTVGSRWLAAAKSAILLVPSVIVPEAFAALINPAHPQAAAIQARAVRRFEYNRLFRR